MFLLFSWVQGSGAYTAAPQYVPEKIRKTKWIQYFEIHVDSRHDGLSGTKRPSKLPRPSKGKFKNFGKNPKGKKFS